MKNKRWTYRIEDSADYDRRIQPSCTLMILVNPEGQDVCGSPNLQHIKEMCATMNRKAGLRSSNGNS